MTASLATQIQSLVDSIAPVDESVRRQAQHQVDQLFKPIGSLGRLETLACQLAAIYRRCDWPLGRKKILVMAADHGVFAEHVAVTPREVTAIQACNTVKGLTGVAALSHANDVGVELLDVGIDSEPIDGTVNIKIARGCGNIASGPAMSREQASQLIANVARYTQQVIDQEQLSVIGIGELGIANTTPAAAIVSVVTGHSPKQVVGLGANFPSHRLAHKVDVVRQAIEANQPDARDGLDIIAKVGGFDLAAMSGAILGASAMRIPVMLDGFLSYASAMIATLLAPNAHGYLIASHLSAEKGASLALNYLQLQPFIDMQLRLGEGSGAALAMPFIDAAHAMVNRMGTMEKHGVPLPSPM
ncbi:nicotinate-nucleotide-dimethylbenzimidazole phosphoribosyltransferase [Vibrio xiamenensis]|uniref:Nicotinate-nucleotide--dimethylbenzimidazole phosphoribosyltransferase n=1 Tax=Vibrio xiamenensis TaxID=861298 RepID=A0A1G8AGL9_9VIBR|nr:nicotinate-nucleotide--dimethylbenzimidazole phosphoribosyltransferase [Vibrio xiamenensis]SDH20145.1 nicotinate-nucleotide-dimethylbenzimidazole phosphoribosyltransferase [Vibrio xiamenensis]